MSVNTKKDKVFSFDSSFFDTLKIMIEQTNALMSKLNDISSSTITEDYGMCNTNYHLRFLTPKDVSTYVSFLIKALKSGLLDFNVNDIESFTVEIIKKLINENGSVAFEDSTMVNSQVFIQNQNQTLQDLIMLHENESYPSTIYSKKEMNNRLKNEIFIKHKNVLENMHFPVNMKKIVDALPDILNAEEDLLWVKNHRELLKINIESFILFACSLNSLTIISMLQYAIPSATYVSKETDNVKSISGVITESCLLKTNDFALRNNLPFDCNIRNVVLQDVHPEFKDTRLAIAFIMSDNRSPICQLVQRHADKLDYSFYDGSDAIVRMFFGHTKDDNLKPSISSDGMNLSSKEEILDKFGFKTSLSWLDDIVEGNNYLDGNYRRDALGNHKSRPILNTLDALYKLYHVQDKNDSKELANNLIKVSTTMLSIIRKYPNGGIENWNLVRDILAVLGEVFTRTMLKLYNNNTQVMDYSDSMPGAMVPGYQYMESFIMEADDNSSTEKDTKVTVSVDGEEGSSTSKLAGVKGKATEIARRFIEWLKQKFSKFYEVFNKNHDSEVKWITKNDKINNDIAQAIANKTFRPNVTNFPNYNIPAQELSNIKIDAVINKWIDADNIEFDTIKKELYPSEVATAVINAKTPGEEAAVLTNYVLYSSTKALPSKTGALTSEEWKSIVNDLKNSMKMIDIITKGMSKSFISGMERLQQKLRKEEIDKPKDGETTTSQTKQLLDLIQQVSTNYGVLTLNLLERRFYGTYYRLYRDIVNLYNKQSSIQKPANQQSTTETNQQQQPNQ